MIKVEKFSYSNIIKESSVVFEKGIYYLKGKNGAGKSTFLDCVSGLNNKYKGLILGNENVVYLNQNLYFDNRLKGKDFVGFVLRLQGIRNGMEYYLERVSKYEWSEDMRELLDKRVGMLSGGERAKLFFSVLCCTEKEWYIFDEPFAGVDEDGVRDMKDIILSLYKEGKNIIITSHEQEGIKGILIHGTYVIENGYIKLLKLRT